MDELENLELETLEVETRVVEANIKEAPKKISEMPAKAQYYQDLFRGGK